LQRFQAIQNELHFLDEQISVTDFVNAGFARNSPARVSFEFSSRA
jgi:hypothetical protein